MMLHLSLLYNFPKVSLSAHSKPEKCGFALTKWPSMIRETFAVHLEQL